MDDRLDLMLADAAPTTSPGSLATELSILVRDTETKVHGRQRRATRYVAGGVLAAALSAGGVAAAASEGMIPASILAFGYDNHRAVPGPEGTQCYEVLLVSPYVDQRNPPPRAEVRAAVAIARSVVSEYEFEPTGERISRSKLLQITAIIDSELEERGLPKAYTLGTGSGCVPADPS